MIYSIQRIVMVLTFSFLIFSVKNLGAANSIPLYSPTTDPLTSKIEEGFNFTVAGGAGFGHGKSRIEFFGVSPWEYGWVSRVPWIELGFGYAPHRDFEFQLQVPLTIVSSSINVYYRMNDFAKLGFKLGRFSSFSSTFSIYPLDDWAISLTPSFSLHKWGNPDTEEFNLSDGTKETLHQSRYLVNGQIAFVRHIDPVDIGFLFHYSYALGDGIYNSFIFDDVVSKYFLKFGLEAIF